MFRVFLTYLLLFPYLFVIAQQKNIPALEREVNIKVTDEAASTVLNKIAAQTGVKFSYSPTSIPADKKITFTLKNKPVRTVLRIMFGESVQYKQKGDFIILTAKPVPAVQVAVKEITISGYVYDQNGDKLTSASILNKSEHISAVSNQYGYYKMLVPADRFPVKLKVEKENYIDTTLTVSSNQTDVDIMLTAPKQTETVIAPTELTIPDTVSEMPVTAVVPDTTDRSQLSASLPPPPAMPVSKAPRKLFDDLLLNDETKANIRNIKDTLFTKVQFSLIPYVSTNKLLVGNTVNDISINLIAGYSQGVNVAEIGGLINIDRGDVKYFQAAGLLNAVGGNVEGVQLAGWGNINSGSGSGLRAAGVLNLGNNMDGVQLAGVLNINADYKSGYNNRSLKGLTKNKVTGVQAAGLMNLNAGYAEGVRLAGLYNAGNDMDGVQMAGLLNVNLGFMRGIQAAGLLNATLDTTDGVQMAGLLNVNVRRLNGVSLAGLVNIALSDMDGVQIAPVLNIAGNMQGFQLGLVNISDSCSGIPIGLLSLSRKGYHKIEIFGDEVIYTQLAFRTGAAQFHNIFTAGVDMTNRADKLWCFGYGIGSTHAIGKKWNFTGDILSQVILIGNRIDDAPQMISLFTGVERTFGKHFSLGFGPACRVMINDSPANGEYDSIVNRLVPYSMYSTTFDNGNTMHMWVGGKISLKFL